MTPRWVKYVQPGDTVKAVSLWEPWASLMALGAKRIETRSWSTSYRGPLLICAAKRKNLTELAELLHQREFWQGLGVAEGTTPQQIIDEILCFGKALCLVDLEYCHRTETLQAHDAIGTDQPFGNFSTGRFGWCTTGRRRLKPFPVVGRQGLFDVTLPDSLESLAPSLDGEDLAPVQVHRFSTEQGAPP